MKPSRSVLKLAAVVSSVLLAGGYIAYQAGAFDRIFGTGTKAQTMGGSKSKTLQFPLTENVQTVPVSPDQLQTIIMQSSKSIAPVIPAPETPQTKPAAPPPETPTLLPGSKAPYQLMIEAARKRATSPAANPQSPPK